MSRSPGKQGECQAATSEVMNFLKKKLVYLDNLHPRVLEELAEEQFVFNVVL